MNLPESTFSTLTDNLVLSKKHGYEFEILVSPIDMKPDIKPDGFQRMVSYLYTHYDLEENLYREQLDVRLVSKKDNKLRLSIIGKDNILNYCKDNTFNKKHSKLITKRRAGDVAPNVSIKEYSIRNNVNIEEDVIDEKVSNQFYTDLKSSKKYFRYKRRFTFFDKKMTHRVDMTVVKDSVLTEATTLKASKTLTNSEKFEVEVEYLNTSKEQPEKALEEIIKTVTELIKKNTNTKFLISKTKQDEVKYEYVKLVDKKITPKQILETPGRYIIRYQPVTLMKRNLLPENVDVISILNDYSVTAKADGERNLIYISSNRDVYFINSRLDIIPTGLRHPSQSKCIMDGEYISKGKLELRLNTILLFDIYFKNGRDVRGKSLLDRHADINTVLNGWNTGELTILLKEFRHGPDILELSEQLLEDAKRFDYYTDGLIYTPLYLPPGALYKNDTSIPAFGGTWNRVFKWKPAGENSIDVLIKLGSDSYVQKENGVNQRYIYAAMYVGFSGSVEQTINIFDIYANTKKSLSKNKVEKRYFDFTYLPVASADGTPQTKYKEDIMDNTIIEMVYTDDPYEKWNPMRIRKDKTAIYQQNNFNIENSANYYNTAMNVWSSIMDPITKDILFGKTILDEISVKQDRKDLYYAGEIPRQRSMLLPLQDFHNYWIKKKNLFDLFKNKDYRLLEIGCGKGGDLGKWLDSGFNTIVGVDNNLDNLNNSEGGAYKRMYDTAQGNGLKYTNLDLKRKNIIFLLMDGGVKWNEDIIETIVDDDLRHLTKIAMGTIAKKQLPNQLLKNVHNVLKEPFDVISCQFAIHYFFESIDKLTNFCWNVNEHLDVGGYFIGTCLDAYLVNEHFVTKGNNILKGVVNDKVLWQIEKKYDKYDNTSEGNNNIGKQIDVYIESINKITPEYLVDFKLLERMLLKYNIKVVENTADDQLPFEIKNATGSFQTLWDSMQIEKAKTGKTHKNIISANNMTDEVKQYSFMNRWFIFKKYT